VEISNYVLAIILKTIVVVADPENSLPPPESVI
jgi:hypothetical protein